MSIKKETLLKYVNNFEFAWILVFVVVGGFADFVKWKWGLGFIAVYLILNIMKLANRPLKEDKIRAKTGEGTDPDKEEK